MRVFIWWLGWASRDIWQSAGNSVTLLSVQYRLYEWKNSFFDRCFSWHFKIYRIEKKFTLQQVNCILTQLTKQNLQSFYIPTVFFITFYHGICVKKKSHKNKKKQRHKKQKNKKKKRSWWETRSHWDPNEESKELQTEGIARNVVTFICTYVLVHCTVHAK